MNGDLCIFDDDDDVRQQLSEMFQELLLANVTQHYGNVENDLLNVSLSLSLSSIVFLNHISLTHTKGPLDGDQCDQIGRFFKVLGYKFSSKSSLNVTFWALLKASLFM